MYVQYTARQNGGPDPSTLDWGTHVAPTDGNNTVTWKKTGVAKAPQMSGSSE